LGQNKTLCYLLHMIITAH